MKRTQTVPQNQYQKIKRNTRIFAIQCLYAWDFTDNPAESIPASIKIVLDLALEPEQKIAFMNVDDLYFEKIFLGTVSFVKQIDSFLMPSLLRNLGDLGGVERAILRLATFELSAQCSVPSRVVLNESIELAKDFGATESFRFINGVLHSISLRLPIILA